jgi:hypothetical protein
MELMSKAVGVTGFTTTVSVTLGAAPSFLQDGNKPVAKSKGINNLNLFMFFINKLN